MAGIGRYESGQVGTALETYWEVEGTDLFFILRLENDAACDYGSDIGIDPKIRVGDSVTYTELDDYTGLWAVTGTEIGEATLCRAVSRVVRNRRFNMSFPREGELPHEWLQELATQTRLSVKLQDKEIAPQAAGTLKRFSPEIREWFLEDLDRIKSIGDSAFEHLVADILRDMDYVIQFVSPTRRKDGGVDIAAWTRSGMPYLIAVQIKHHRTHRTTGVADVRDLAGTLDRNPVFRFGFLVTNTSFTEDARSFAEPLGDKIRLRDITDLERWMNGGVDAKDEWKEIPDEVDLGLGVSFPVHPQAPNPDDAFWKYQQKSVVELLTGS